MTTAEALEALTDEGKFELLAAAAIGLRNYEYGCLISTGVNARGKTIVSPVDGFNLVPDSNPPHFVMLACTTTDRKHLRGKLLGAEGDLAKAAELAESLRKEFQDARFTVVVATNRCLDEALLRDLHTEASEAGVSCDPWEQSRLARDLDMHPSGQWLRKRYLGIEAELLSRELLLNISRASCESYEDHTSSLLGMNWVARGVDGKLEQLVASPATTLIFLIGKPGLGKSVAACRQLRATISNGGNGLWLPAEVLLGNPSMGHAIDAHVQKLHGAPLLDRPGRVSQALDPHERLLVVVDDVNRLSDPLTSLRKLVGWIREPGGISEQDRVPAYPVAVICPVWPAVWRGICQFVEKRPDIAGVHLGLMEMSEAIEFLHAGASDDGHGMNRADAIRVARKYNRDPFLLGMARRMGVSCMAPSPQLDLIESFVKMKTDELGIGKRAALTACEYRVALLDVAKRMIRERSFCVAIETIRGWFSDRRDLLDGIRDLANQGEILEQDNDGLVRFRHDRLLRHFGALALRTFLRDSPQDEVLSDPWFAEWTAEACLAESPGSDVLKRVMSSNPSCVIELVLGLDRANQSFAEDVLQFVIADLSQGQESKFSEGTLYGDLCSSLLDSPCTAVSRLRPHLPTSLALLLGGLHCGQAMDGITYCASRLGWYPSLSDGRLEYCLSDIRDSDAKDALVESIATIVDSGKLTQEGIAGALSLAGALADPRLSKTIARCWNFTDKKEDVLLNGLWAALRCGDCDHDIVTRPLIEAWASLSDTPEKPHCLSDRNEVGDSLRLALAYNASPAIVRYLLDVAEEIPELRWAIRIALADIDAPDAIEFNLALLSEGRYMFDSIRWSPRYGRRSLGDESRTRLLEIWADPSRNEKLRRYAFTWWTNAATPKDAPTLRAVDAKDVLSSAAVRARAILGDRSVVPQLETLLREDPWNFHVAALVWVDDFEAIADGHLREIAAEDYHPFTPGYTAGQQGLVECLARISPDASNSLLERNWPHLSSRPKFIELALYVGRPSLLEKTRAAFECCPQGVHAVRHIELHLGWQYSPHDPPPQIVLDRVERLLPHLAKLDEHDVYDLVHACIALRETRVLSRLQSYLADDMRPRILPTDEDLLNELDELAGQSNGVWRAQFVVEQSARRGDAPYRIPKLIARWLPARSDPEALGVAGEIIAHVGRRGDIGILDSWGGDTASAEFVRARSETWLRVQRRTLV